MQIVIETEYQDIYRIADGVLFVVNKFIPINYYPKFSGKIYLHTPKTGRYNKKCQNYLTVLKEDFVYSRWDQSITIPKGTILYRGLSVQATTDDMDFTYQIKTTGDAFSGDALWMENAVSKILYRIRTGRCR